MNKNIKNNKIEEIFFINREKKGINVALFYPNSYFAGSTNLGYQKIFEKLNQWGFSVNRFFFENNKLFSPDTNKSLKNFDFIFISISYESDIINLLYSFIIEDIFINKELRKKNVKINNIDVFIGGAAVALNPFFYGYIGDYVYLGDIDSIENFEDFIKNCLKINNNEIISNDLKYQEILEYFIKLFKKRKIYNENGIPSFTNYVDINDKNFYFLIEYSRGCKFNCKFCNYWVYSKNYRIFNFEEIIKKINKGIKYKKDIGIISAYPPDFNFLKELYNNFKEVNFHFSSLRVEENSENILEYYKKFNINTLTIAPETPDENDRILLGKSISDDVLTNFLNISKKIGFNKFKFYFIIGLFDNELEKFIKFLNKYKVYLKDSFVKFSINPYIKKNFSIIKNSLIDEKSYNQIIKELRKIFLKYGIKFDFLNYNDALIQYNISNLEVFIKNKKYIFDKLHLLNEMKLRDLSISRNLIKEIFLFFDP